MFTSLISFIYQVMSTVVKEKHALKWVEWSNQNFFFEIETFSALKHMSKKSGSDFFMAES